MYDLIKKETALKQSDEPVEFEVYYQVDGKDTDCCTLTGYLNKRDMDDLAEFVRMYR